MIKTLRAKMLLGMAPLLAIMIGLGAWAIVMFSRLGGDIDVILRENYRSVLAAEGMKESLERMDSSYLFAIGGEEARARAQFLEFRPRFEHHLKIEQNNITLPGEQRMADDLTTLFGRYCELAEQFYRLPAEPKAQRTAFYFAQLLPMFEQIKRRAEDVLELNQKNMEDENTSARQSAAWAIRAMVLVLAGSAVMATLIALRLSRTILEPIGGVTLAAREMARGDLDQIVPVLTHDERGELAAAFNSMARTIREFRQAGTERLVRAQKTAQATIDSFPDPVIVVDPGGAVERTNPAARRVLGVEPTGGAIPWLAPPAIRPHLAEVLAGGPSYLPAGLDHVIAARDSGHERYFLPRVLAIRSDEVLVGAAVVLQDVTKLRLVDQLKSDMVSTVSHELKTPLTSVQMAVHLLLEESVGLLTTKQTELLLAARNDSDRLLAMINDLLDLTRIEQGRVQLDVRAVAPADLVQDAIERYAPQARDAGIDLKAAVAFGLPPVPVDRERIEHVFDNLINNALAHATRGSRVSLSAEDDAGSVRFAFHDTGEGIAPEHLPHVFDKFFRVPGSRSAAGAGLGLTIAREIVQAHGGEIQVESQPGEGTTFTVILPTAREVEADGRGTPEGVSS
jgi:signal transduction histidine kinase